MKLLATLLLWERPPGRARTGKIAAWTPLPQMVFLGVCCLVSLLGSQPANAKEAHESSSNVVAQGAAVLQGQSPPASPGQPVAFPGTRWADSVTATNDPTYQRIILPWLKEKKLEFPAEGDGLLVVYQPWGFVSGAALFVPGKTAGSLALLNDAQVAVRQLPLPSEEWDGWSFGLCGGADQRTASPGLSLAT